MTKKNTISTVRLKHTMYKLHSYKKNATKKGCHALMLVLVWYDF